MKVCKHCNTECDLSVSVCPSCGGVSFNNKCPNCGSIYEVGNFCPICGVKANAVEKECPNCGTRYFSVACPSCGYIKDNQKSNTQNPSITREAPLTQYTIVTNKKQCDKVLALILCIIFGYLGAHKFYEGRAGMGILYLCTLGLFGIGWIVDIFVLLGKPDKYYV